MNVRACSVDVLLYKGERLLSTLTVHAPLLTILLPVKNFMAVMDLGRRSMRRSSRQSFSLPVLQLFPFLCRRDLLIFGVKKPEILKARGSP